MATICIFIFFSKTAWLIETNLHRGPIGIVEWDLGEMMEDVRHDHIW